MTYLIDGHNLVPHVPGMSLQHLDDEEQLIARLQQFCLRQRRKVVVFFDRATPGGAGKRVRGQVEAHFVREGIPADQAIISHLRRQGKGAANWTVVTSDRTVAAEARALRAGVMPSEAFARLLLQLQMEEPAGDKPEASPSEREVEEWMEIFRRNPQGGGRPGDKSDNS